MLLTQCTGRARLLGSLRLCVLGVGSYHDDVGATVATRILSRQAGGVAGKRNNKYRGQFKASAVEMALPYSYDKGISGYEGSPPAVALR